MSQNVSQVGSQVFKGTTAENTATVTPISINAATTLILPAKPTANQPGGFMPRPGLVSGAIEVNIIIEGTSTSRYTTNGVTPTAAIGQLVPAPTATTPVQLILRGRDVLLNFQIIGTAAGNTITYEYYTADQGA